MGQIQAGEVKNKGGRPKGKKNVKTEREKDIKRWTKQGLFKLADKAIQHALKDIDQKATMARWIYEQKNGKAPATLPPVNDGERVLLVLDV